MSGVARIANERQRQIEEENWDLEHDQSHRADQLALAAACYALPEPTRLRQIWGVTLVQRLWPWDTSWWKPSSRDAVDETEARIRELEKAGALIAAEIDRLEASARLKVGQRA